MNRIDIQLYETRNPNSNFKFFDNLSDIGKEQYLKLYLKYSDLLYKYMIKKLELQRFDNLLLNSPCKFKKIKENDMDLYQKLGSKHLKYFYIRNNLYIERLSNEELNDLINLTMDDLDSHDFIEKTYFKVLLEDPDPNSKLITIYGPDNKEFIKPSNVIVIGYSYVKFDKDENNIDEWIKLNDKRLLELDFLNIAFNKLTKDKLKTNIILQKYI